MSCIGQSGPHWSAAGPRVLLTRFFGETPSVPHRSGDRARRKRVAERGDRQQTVIGPSSLRSTDQVALPGGMVDDVVRC